MDWEFCGLVVFWFDGFVVVFGIGIGLIDVVCSGNICFWVEKVGEFFVCMFWYGK